jgi:hypothetical protein
MDAAHAHPVGRAKKASAWRRSSISVLMMARRRRRSFIPMSIIISPQRYSRGEKEFATTSLADRHASDLLGATWRAFTNRELRVYQDKTCCYVHA